MEAYDRTGTGRPGARDAMQEEIKPQVAAFVKTHGRPPGLGIVLVGDDPASQVYVRNKVKAGGDVGFRVDLERMPATSTLADVLALVDRLNASDRYRRHPGAVAAAEGDGRRRATAGRSTRSRRTRTWTASARRTSACSSQNRPKLVACTPAGVIELLEREQIPIAGRHAVVIGRSDIVGKPMALLLLHRDATVTICHSRTPDLPAVCREADILVAAIGRAGSRHAGLRQAGRGCDRRRHQPRHRSGNVRARLFPAGHRAAGVVPAKGSRARRRRAPRGRGGRRRADAGAGRRRAADDHDADEEHAARGAETA